MMFVPKIIGILNTSPDSFYDGGRYSSLDKCLIQIEKMVSIGVNIIDIGGASTRPNAIEIDDTEEISRIKPVIDLAKKTFNITISIDTYKEKVMEVALDSGASIINTVRGISGSNNILKLLHSYNAKIINMHSFGIIPPPLMRAEDLTRKNILEIITKDLVQDIDFLTKNNIDKKNIIIDPGIGFSKTAHENLIVIKNIEKLKILNTPICLGVSRKSFIGSLLNIHTEDRLIPSLAIATMAILKGIDYIRVHDINETKLALDTITGILESDKHDTMEDLRNIF